MTDLFPAPPTYPKSVLLSIYNAYPRKTGRPAALKRIREALDRICQGEIDGSPRTQAEAIEFLRVKTEEARRQMGAREKHWIPHMATWLHQSRYLRPDTMAIVEQTERMDACIRILAEYPMIIDAKQIMDMLPAYMPALNAIDKALEMLEGREMRTGTPESAARYLKYRTRLYVAAVKQWPAADLKFVPNPVKWFSEARYDQPAESWQRQSANDYLSEREQLGRILNRSAQTGNGGSRPN
jgi:hypothetical protein